MQKQVSSLANANQCKHRVPFFPAVLQLPKEPTNNTQSKTKKMVFIKV